MALPITPEAQEAARRLFHEHLQRLIGKPRFAQPKRTRRSRRRARGRAKAGGLIPVVKDWHFGEITPTMRRNAWKQMNYFFGAYHAPKLRPDVYTRGALIDVGDVLHEFRTFSAIDWGKLEARALVVATDGLTTIAEQTDKALWNAALYGSSDSETSQGHDDDSTQP